MCVIIQSNKTKLMDINSGNKFSLIISVMYINILWNIQEWKNVSIGSKIYVLWNTYSLEDPENVVNSGGNGLIWTLKGRARWLSRL